jgi:hypothetical protein
MLTADAVARPAQYRGELLNFAAGPNDLPATKPCLHGWHALCFSEFVQSV